MTAICRFVLVLPAVVLILGCSKNSNSPSSVSGKVTYKGEVVPAGMIPFHVKSGGIYSYAIAEGMYSGKDLPAEEMVVTIDTEGVNPNKTKPAYGAGQGNQPDMRGKMQEMGKIPGSAAPATGGKYVKIPAKYASKEKTPLKVTFTKGNNENNFDLTDD